jgi:hypothetical protein
MSHCLRLREMGLRPPKFCPHKFPYSSIAARRLHKSMAEEAFLVNSRNALAEAFRDLEDIWSCAHQWDGRGWTREEQDLMVAQRAQAGVLLFEDCDQLETALEHLSWQYSRKVMLAALMRSAGQPPAFLPPTPSTISTSRNQFMENWGNLTEQYKKLKQRLRGRLTSVELWSRDLTSEMARSATLLRGWTL